MGEVSGVMTLWEKWKEDMLKHGMLYLVSFLASVVLGYFMPELISSLLF